MRLTRDAILAAPDLPVEEVQVPEWGGSVFVRAMTGTERDAFERESMERNGTNVTANTQNIRARLLARTIVDEHGKRLFTDEDALELGAKSAAALDRVVDVAQRLSRIRADDVEDLAKNSASEAVATSISSSH